MEIRISRLIEALLLGYCKRPAALLFPRHGRLMFSKFQLILTWICSRVSEFVEISSLMAHFALARHLKNLRASFVAD